MGHLLWTCADPRAAVARLGPPIAEFVTVMARQVRDGQRVPGTLDTDRAKRVRVAILDDVGRWALGDRDPVRERLEGSDASRRGDR